VAEALAALQGCERATLAPSTMHLFWDLFGILASDRVAVYMDAGTYPIARWGVERAAARGVPVRSFPHHNAEALQQHLKQDARRRLRPLIVADGFCPGCGVTVPIADYVECARAFGGQVILDDTQALGIFGQSPGADAPYGRGGGGMLRWSQIEGPDVLVISSLAKGFGAPVAVLSGSQAMVERFEAKSETRVHTSPASLAVIHAAEQALAVNREQGDGLRLRLARLVRHFRSRLARAGLAATGGLFPVQTLAPVPDLEAVMLHQRLLERGVRTVLHHARNGHGARLSFLITTNHQPDEMDRVVNALADAARKTGEKIIL
jgi:8-amino-7-oxononanoate synthase